MCREYCKSKIHLFLLIGTKGVRDWPNWSLNLLNIRGNLGVEMGLLRKIFFFLNNKIIFINFGGKKEKTTFLCSYFQHICLCFYSNLDRESSLDVKFNSTSKEYAHCILLMDPATPKTRNTWKMWWWHHHHFFPGISYF